MTHIWRMSSWKMRLCDKSLSVKCYATQQYTLASASICTHACTQAYRHVILHTQAHRHVILHTQAYRHVILHMHAYRHVILHTQAHRHVILHTHAYNVAGLSTNVHSEYNKYSITKYYAKN